MPNILICDDERDIVNALKIYLTAPDLHLLEAYNGKEALEAVRTKEIDLVLLEISKVPIILLSAKSEDTDKILGLNVGADDYITKPFNPLEVTARVRSQLRRYLQFGGSEPAPERLVIGGIELDDVTKEVTVDGAPVSLTPKEYEILKLLMSSPDRVYSPKEIYTAVWKEKPFGTDNTVAVHIRHIREKIEIIPSEPRYLKVLFGQGYKMEKGK